MTATTKDDDTDYVVLRADIREEIDALIEQYKMGDKKPPFTAAELIVMAILCSSRRALTPQSILK